MDVTVNMWAVFWAAVAAFVVGAVWYMPIFGNLWGKIHGFDKLDKKTQKEMQKGMAPLMVVQFILGLVTAFVLAHVIAAFPDENAYKLGVWMWLGFIVPTQLGAVIFGGTAPQWMVKKALIMAGGALAVTMTMAWVIQVVG